jgi:error-prone DNA polymerase
MRIVQGLAQADAEAILAARADGPFTSIEETWRRSGVKPAALERLARADAFQCLGLDRRQALWEIKALGSAPLPLLAAADAREGAVRPEAAEVPVALAPLTAGRETVEDYRATQLSLRAHPLAFLRDRLRQRGISPCGALLTAKDGARIEVAGIILVRQRPGSAKSVFITLEDESGIANAIVWEAKFKLYRRVVMSSAMVSIRGRVQREGLVVHLIADSLADLTPLLRQVGDLELPRLTMPSDGTRSGGRDHREPEPRQGELIPIKSRNFH